MWSLLLKRGTRSILWQLYGSPFMQIDGRQIIDKKDSMRVADIHPTWSLRGPADIFRCRVSI